MPCTRMQRRKLMRSNPPSPTESIGRRLTPAPTLDLPTARRSAAAPAFRAQWPAAEAAGKLQTIVVPQLLIDAILLQLPPAAVSVPQTLHETTKRKSARARFPASKKVSLHRFASPIWHHRRNLCCRPDRISVRRNLLVEFPPGALVRNPTAPAALRWGLHLALRRNTKCSSAQFSASVSRQFHARYLNLPKAAPRKPNWRASI